MNTNGPKEPGSVPRPRAPLPLLTRLQLAEAFGVDPLTITRWERERPPLPVHASGGPNRASLYALPAVISWRLDRERTKAGPQGNGHLSRELEQAKLAAANTERVKLDVLRRRGKLVDAEVAGAAWSSMITAARSRMLALPRALAERLVHEAARGPAAVEAALMDGVRECLTALAEWRPA